MRYLALFLLLFALPAHADTLMGDRNGVTVPIPVGTTAGTVAAGDDSRLSDSRNPLAHKSTHATGGSDALTAGDIGAATAAQGAKADSMQTPCSKLVCASNAANKAGCDYIADGTGDEVEIQAAINSTGTYGVVCLSDGVFETDATITEGNSYFTLRGQGGGATVIHRNTDYGDTILVSPNDPVTTMAWNVTIQGIKFHNETVAMTTVGGTLPYGSAHIHLKSVGRVNLYDNEYRGHLGAILNEGGRQIDITNFKANTGLLYISGEDTYNFKSILGPGNGTAVDPQSYSVQVRGMEFGSESTGFYKYGFWIQSLDDFSVTGGHLNGYTHSGLLLDKAVDSKSIVTGRFQGVYFDGNTSGPDTHAVTIQGTGGTGNYGGYTFTGGAFMGQATTEKALYINSSTFKGLTVNGNDIWNYTQDGIDVVAGSGITITGNRVSKNNTSGGGYSGISIANDITDVNITGNDIGGETPVGSGIQTVGLKIGTGVTGSFAPNTFGSGNTTAYTVGSTAQNLRLHGPIEFADGTSMTTAAVGGGGGGSGDVTATASIDDNAIVRGDGGVKGIQTSPVTIDDNGVIGATTVKMTASVTDSASAKAFVFDTTNALSTNGATLWELNKAGVSQAHFNRLGKFKLGGTIGNGVTYPFEIANTTKPQIVLSTIETNNSAKSSGIGQKHYTNTEEPLGIFSADSGANYGWLYLGGGSGAVNAPTKISAYVAANNTTVTGTELWRLTTTGLAVNPAGVATDPTQAVDVVGSVKASGQIISSVATGTAPLQVASTTNVPNLNASSLNGATFAAPGPIGSGTPSTVRGTSGTFGSDTVVLSDYRVKITGSMMASGGYGFSSTKESEGDIPQGTLFEPSALVNNNLRKTLVSSQKFIGVAVAAYLNSDSVIEVITKGPAAVLLENGTACTRGDFVSVSATVGGRAICSGTAPTDTFKLVGIAMASASAGTDVTVVALLK